MALTLTEAQSVQSNYFQKDMPVLVYEKDPLLWMLKKKKNISWNGGNNLQFPIRYRELGKAQWVDPREQLTYESKTTRTAATEVYRRAVASAVIHWDERDMNSGKAQIINLLADKEEEIQQDMYEQFSDALYASTQATKAINSLIATIIVATGTLHGISQSDVAAWAGVVDTAETRLTLYGNNSLSETLNDCEFGTEGVDLIQTTRDLKSKAESLVQAAEGFYQEDKEMADAGFKNVKFHGIPIVGNPKITASAMLLLDTDNLELMAHPDANFARDNWDNLKAAGFPKALVRNMFFSGNLICKSRQTQGRYSALDYTL